MLDQRRCGILLHPTSLPGDYGIGTIGQDAYRWLDFLKESGQSLWQMLPVQLPGYGSSPYQTRCSMAGNIYLLDPKPWFQKGWLSQELFESYQRGASQKVDFSWVESKMDEILDEVISSLEKGLSREQELDLEAFCDRQWQWIYDYALYMALREEFSGKPWWEWPKSYRDRDRVSLERFSIQKKHRLDHYVKEQWLFDQQWRALRQKAKERGVLLVGDVAIYVAHDSVQTWSRRELFCLDEKGQLKASGGVPPDDFSEEGQHWGSPLYDWKAHEREEFSWWIARIRRNLELFDRVRLDHFIGFVRYWSIPSDAESAKEGEWKRTPCDRFFKALGKAFGESLPLIAEDLGEMGEDVEKVRDGLGLAGMKILQFGFEAGGDNLYLPHQFIENCVVYSGTHDNRTLKSALGDWPSKTLEFIKEYLDLKEDPSVQDLIEAGNTSCAQWLVVPLQDYLELEDQEGRMNVPGEADGNWGYRCLDWRAVCELQTRLLKMAIRGDRHPDLAKGSLEKAKDPSS